MSEQQPSAVDRINELWEDHSELTEFLRRSDELTLLTRAEDAFRKTLIIAIASYFEVLLVEAIRGVYFDQTQGSDALTNFVEKQALARRYSQLFSWGAGNANAFFGKFGREFKKHMKAKVDDDVVLADSISAFLELGRLRNQMVHGNYVDFQPLKSIDEIYALYHSALIFANGLPGFIKDYVVQESR